MEKTGLARATVANAIQVLEELHILVDERRLERPRITRVSPITGMLEAIITTLGVEPLPARVPGRTLISAADATRVCSRPGWTFRWSFPLERDCPCYIHNQMCA